MMNVTFTRHALFEMHRRDLTEEIVKNVIDHPDQCWEIREGRYVYQRRVNIKAAGKKYLVRAFADVTPDQIEVVTAYRTSKIEKYWREKS